MFGYLIKRCVPFLLFCSVLPAALAVDVVRMNTNNVPNDPRDEYKMTVLKMALEKSRVNYGDFKIIVVDLPTTAKRALHEVQTGKNINLFIGVTSIEWEEKNLPIRVPIRRGILSHRLLAINKNSLSKFSNLATFAQLKHLASGLRVGWTTTDIFKQQQMAHFELESLDGLYHMLNNGAIDYIPRGINEIYDEISLRKPNDIVVEPNIALYLNAPTYIFVSPNETRLAKRIEEGLERMVSDGSLKSLFYQRYASDLQKANIKNRKIIIIPNPQLPETIPFERPELWYHNDQPAVHAQSSTTQQ